MKLLTLALVLLAVSPLTSCTENARARSFGGTATVELPAGQKLFDVTWKDNDLWYATRKRRDGEAIETYSFQEDSSLGLLEGKVVFVEN